MIFATVFNDLNISSTRNYRNRLKGV